MSMMAHPGSLDTRTLADIDRLNGGCGCQKANLLDARWSICDYHGGYDAALEMHARGPDPLPEGLQ